MPGILPDEQVENSLTSLGLEELLILIRMQDFGALANRVNSKAVGAGGAFVEGSVGGGYPGQYAK